MKPVISAALSVALILTVSPPPADAGQDALKSWANKMVKRELETAESRLGRAVNSSKEKQAVKNELKRAQIRLSDRLNDRFDALAEEPPETSYVVTGRTIVPVNHQLTEAQVGDLAIVFVCMLDGNDDPRAGGFVVSEGEDFEVVLDGETVLADSLGYFFRMSWSEAHPTRPDGLFREGSGAAASGGTTMDGETFTFEPWAVVIGGSDTLGCEFTSTIIFNGSDEVVTYPGADPVPLATRSDDDRYVTSAVVAEWSDKTIGVRRAIRPLSNSMNRNRTCLDSLTAPTAMTARPR